MRLDTSQAAQRWQQRFLVGGIGKKELQVVRRIDGDGGIFELGDGSGPKTVSFVLGKIVLACIITLLDH